MSASRPVAASRSAGARERDRAQVGEQRLGAHRGGRGAGEVGLLGRLGGAPGGAQHGGEAGAAARQLDLVAEVERLDGALPERDVLVLAERVACPACQQQPGPLGVEPCGPGARPRCPSSLPVGAAVFGGGAAVVVVAAGALDQLRAPGGGRALDGGGERAPARARTSGSGRGTTGRPRPRRSRWTSSAREASAASTSPLRPCASSSAPMTPIAMTTSSRSCGRSAAAAASTRAGRRDRPARRAPRRRTRRARARAGSRRTVSRVRSAPSQSPRWYCVPRRRRAGVGAEQLPLPAELARAAPGEGVRVLRDVEVGRARATASRGCTGCGSRPARPRRPAPRRRAAAAARRPDPDRGCAVRASRAWCARRW